MTTKQATMSSAQQMLPMVPVPGPEPVRTASAADTLFENMLGAVSWAMGITNAFGKPSNREILRMIYARESPVAFFYTLDMVLAAHSTTGGRFGLTPDVADSLVESALRVVVFKPESDILLSWRPSRELSDAVSSFVDIKMLDTYRVQVTERAANASQMAAAGRGPTPTAGSLITDEMYEKIVAVVEMQITKCESLSERFVFSPSDRKQISECRQTSDIAVLFCLDYIYCMLGMTPAIATTVQNIVSTRLGGWKIRTDDWVIRSWTPSKFFSENVLGPFFGHDARRILGINRGGYFRIRPDSASSPYDYSRVTSSTSAPVVIQQPDSPPSDHAAWDTYSSRASTTDGPRSVGLCVQRPRRCKQPQPDEHVAQTSGRNIDRDGDSDRKRDLSGSPPVAKKLPMSRTIGLSNPTGLRVPMPAASAVRILDPIPIPTHGQSPMLQFNMTGVPVTQSELAAAMPSMLMPGSQVCGLLANVIAAIQARVSATRRIIFSVRVLDAIAAQYLHAPGSIWSLLDILLATISSTNWSNISQHEEDEYLLFVISSTVVPLAYTHSLFMQSLMASLI